MMVRHTAKSAPLGGTTPQIELNARACQMHGPLTNSRHEAFAQAMAAGMTADAAYAQAGYQPSRAHASRLAANGSVAARITALKAQAAARTIEKIALTDADFISRLLREADYYGDGSSHGARVQAVRLIGDHLGLLKQRIEHDAMDGFAKAIAEISRAGSAVPVATDRVHRQSEDR